MLEDPFFKMFSIKMTGTYGVLIRYRDAGLVKPGCLGLRSLTFPTYNPPRRSKVATGTLFSSKIVASFAVNFAQWPVSQILDTDQRGLVTEATWKVLAMSTSLPDPLWTLSERTICP